MTHPVARALANADAVEAALSLERFARYVAWADGDRQKAVDLYTLNTQVSEALYVSLQALEVVADHVPVMSRPTAVASVSACAHAPGRRSCGSRTA